MVGTLNPRVKICCISSIDEAKFAIEHGASAIGLVSNMPSGPGIISNNLIEKIAVSIPSHINTFLLTSEQKAEAIIDQVNGININTIQLVSKIKEEDYVLLRNKLPSIKITQVIHVKNENAVVEAFQAAKFVDYILLDSGNPDKKILGGTGKTHNWEISKTIREKLEIPVYLAGGLNSQNVRAAIETVQAYGIDLCSGVRTNGHLDLDKLKAFFVSKDNTL